MKANRKKAAAQDAIHVLGATWGWNPPKDRGGNCTMLTAIRYYNRHHCKAPDRLALTDDLIAAHIPLDTDLHALDTDDRRAMVRAAKNAIETAMKEAA